MKYTIQETPTFTIFGVKREIKTDNAFELVPQFWREYRKNGTLAKFADSLTINNISPIPSGILGIVTPENASKRGIMDYYIASSNPSATKDIQNIETYNISATTWIVFEGNRKKDVSSIYDYFYSQWLPAAAYKKRINIPVIESYSLNHKYMHTWSPFYIWFAIEAK